MTNLYSLLLLLTTLLLLSLQCKADIIRACYLTSRMHEVPQSVSWSHLKYRKNICTHIIYGFVGLNSNGTINVLSKDSVTIDFQHLKRLRRRNRHLKTLLSIIPINSSFVEITANNNINRLAKSIVEFAKAYYFNGIDLYWNNVENSKQTLQFIGFLKSMGSNDFLITVAVSKYLTGENGVYLKKLSQHVDYFNVMAYNYHDRNGTTTGIVAPLYRNGGFNVMNTIGSYQKFINSSKILLGLTTIARGWTLPSFEPNNNLKVPASNFSNPLNFTQHKGAGAYYEMCMMAKNALVNFFDENTHTSFVQQGDQWFSWEDMDAIVDKVSFAKSKELAGVFVWTMEHDDINGECGYGRWPVLRAILDNQ